MIKYLILACLCVPVLAAPAQPLVILLSWDGVRHDAFSRAELPAIQRMLKQGASAQRMVPIYPSNTFPTHISMATGAPPTIHGIIDNHFFDKQKGVNDFDTQGHWLNAEPLWITTERQGVKAATYFWPASTFDWRGFQPSYTIKPFSDDVADGEKVKQIIQWMDLPAEQRPGLIMSYWHGVDGVSHRKGPNHPDVFKQLKRQDEVLAGLLRALDERNAWSYTTLMIVSDHGMTEVKNIIDITGVLEQAEVKADVYGAGEILHLFLPEQQSTQPVLDALAGISEIKAYTAAELVGTNIPTFENRTGDIVVTTQPPNFLRPLKWWQQSALDLMYYLDDWQLGMHGYNPEHPDMGAIFLAMGRSVNPQGELGVVSQLDVAATVTSLLGLQPPLQSQGKPITLN